MEDDCPPIAEETDARTTPFDNDTTDGKQQRLDACPFEIRQRWTDKDRGKRLAAPIIHPANHSARSRSVATGCTTENLLISGRDMTQYFPTSRLSFRVFALTGALIASGLAPLLTQAADLIPLTATQRAAFGIELAAPEATGEARSRRYPAKVTVPNPQLRVVSAPQDGILDALLVAEGQNVVHGQLLAELRSPGIVDLQSAFLEATTRLELAASELARDQRLARDGLIAERRLLETQARHRELTTTVEQQRQRLAIAGLSDADIKALRDSRQLSSTLPIRAPLAGVVLEQMVATGESVAAATPLYRIAQLDPLWLEVHVPVDDISGPEGKLALGMRAWVPGLNRAGEIITIGRMVHERDQGVLVRAELHDESGQLRPGQFVEVQLAASGDGWTVPASALVRQSGLAYVFAARPDGFAAVPVTVLSEQDESALIANPVAKSGGNPGGSGGLSADDRIAISGTVALKAIWLGGAAGSEGGGD